MIRVISVFSGYDSQCMALDRIGVEYDLVAWAEIDKYAIAAHNAVYPQYAERNVGDVSLADWTKVEGDVDLLTYSSPCQDFSAAGLMRGGDEGSGTRSSLLWEVKRAIEVLRPKYLLMENVKNLVSKRFVGVFNDWLKVLEDYGYTNQWAVVNAKDFDVPQNRERVFVASSRVGLSGFGFPSKLGLHRRLKDVLEEKVEEKYYLRAEQVEGILEHCDRKVKEGCGFREAFRTPEEMATCISTKYGSRQTDTYVVEEVYGLGRTRDKKGNVANRPVQPYVNCVHTGIGGQCWDNMEVYAMEVVAGAVRGRDKGENGYIQKLELNTEGTTNTLTSVAKDNYIVEYKGRWVRIRRLTPTEAFRLMDVDDSNIEKIKAAGISEAQMYKLAGNSIVVAPMAGILKNLLLRDECETDKPVLL